MRDKKIIRVSIYGIIVNIILVIFKMLVGFVVNSIAIVLDAVNNLSDVLSSLITIVGTKLAKKKPDKRHPYGHGRIEYFSSIIISVIIMTAGFTSFKESLKKIFSPVMPNYSVASLIIVFVAIFVKFFFGKYVKRQGEELKSNNLIASGVDALSDSVLSLSTFITALICILFKISLEGYLGVIISIVILKSSISILRDTVDEMIGTAGDISVIKELEVLVLSNVEVLGVYDVSIHTYGVNSIIGTIHIQVNDLMTAKEIHRLSRKISIDVYEKLGIILTVGIYATNDVKDCKKIRSYINKLISNYPSIKQIHGFYVDEDEKNISFDLMFTYEENEKDKIIEDIKNNLKIKYPDYNYSIIVDMDYIGIGE